MGRRVARLAVAGSAAFAIGCSDGGVGVSQWHPAGPPKSGGAETPTTGSSGPSGGGTTTGGATSGPPADGTPSGTQGPNFELAIGDAAITADLLASKSTVVTVAPINGFSGTVSLTLEAPQELAASLDKGSLDVSAAAGATANLTLTSGTAGDHPFKITATAGALTASKSVTFTTTKTLLITIPSDAEADKGTLANPRLDAFGPASGIVVHAPLPLTLNFVNRDATPHVIHAGGQNGFFHSDSPITQDAMDKVRTITAAGSYPFYLHDQGPVTLGTLILKTN